MPFPFKRARVQQEPSAFSRSILDAVKAFYAPPKHDRRQRASQQAVAAAAAATANAAYVPVRHPHRITLLPPEVLAHVFVLGAEEDAMFPVTVSHVCRAWRYVALHTPRLWRRITLDSGSLAMWAQRIHRAKACTLDVQLAPQVALAPLPYFNHVQLCMHTVAPHVHRWRSLEVRFRGYAPFLWNAALSAALTLMYPDNDDTKEFALFNGFAPRLRRATIHGIRLVWTPSLFQNLTFLDYTHHGFTRGPHASAEVLYMLQVSSNLEDLRLAFPWKGDAPSRYALSASFSRAVHLPRLRKLALYVEGPDVPPALTYALPHLSLPALRALFLVSPPARHAFPHLRTVLKAFPRLPPLHHLHLAHAWLDDRFLPALLAAVPPGTPGALTLTLEGAALSHALLAAALRHVAPRRLRALALVRAPAQLTADALVDVLGRVAGAPLQLQAAGAGAFRLPPPPLAAVYVRDCAGVDWRSLAWLQAAGIALRVWEGGREVDLRYPRAVKKARFR
ncbi:uncharacterized protein BXZ73DRAFT_91115 [Epithele typhae]|uniref:uncharacterized protein n=1 Tax=Epithele typhae TaxID=378194 RepID=UPI002008613B|nr:uncharacterized protein BXZ73DRAFT_91115 [Epithele typhae]KAH9925388.1 hypothetical protein BXZ73DRAFT_91115 [Epithele typhae]